MSRPRKPYGPNPPGRLPATLIKVLAAELSDQGRLSRGKRYWADDAVIDLVIGHGAVTAEIQGSRPDPYVVTLEAAAGSGVPGKRELWVHCTCPDDGAASSACKHAVAALFALSDEIAIDPDLLTRWRAEHRRPAGDPHAATDAAEADVTEADVTELRPNRSTPETHPERSTPARVVELHPRHDPDLDAIAMLLRSPTGTEPPDLPEPSPIDHGPIRDHLLAEVLDDALDHLAIRWD